MANPVTDDGEDSADVLDGTYERPEVHRLAGTIRAAREFGSEIIVTASLARAIAPLIEDDNSSVMIQYFPDDPEQHWHVTIDYIDHSVAHLIDDETGKVLATKTVGPVERV